MTILILDAQQRSALAATRSLGKKGIPVITADSTLHTLAGSSKYSGDKRVYPSPYSHPLDFLDWLDQLLAAENIETIFPMTEVTTDLVTRHANRWPHINIPFAPIETIDSLANKIELHKMAEKLNIAIPPTYYVSSPQQAVDLLDALEFPVVLKPYRSRIWLGDKWLATTVCFATNPTHYQQLINSEPFASHPYMVQKLIKGIGQGVFALYDRGTPKLFFAHKRLRERPPSGGVSVWSESALPTPHLQQIAETLLTAARWHGVAMVEFKVAEDGTPYLMEINTRFWGSLQLAIDAGADFPYALYQLSQNHPIDNMIVKPGVRLRWLLGDLDNLYLNLRNKNLSLFQKLLVIVGFLKPDFSHTRHEIDRFDDLGPAAHEFRQYFGLTKP